MKTRLRLSLALLAALATAARAQVREIPDVPAALAPSGSAAAAALAAPSNISLAPVSQSAPAPLPAPVILVRPGPVAAAARVAPARAGASLFEGARAAAPRVGAAAPRVGAAAPQVGAAADPQDEAVRAGLASFQRYARGILGGIRPTDEQTRALFEMYLEERGIRGDSGLAERLERELLPGAPAVSPRLKDYAPMLRKLSRESGVPVPRLESMIREHGLESVLAGPHEADLLANTLSRLIHAEQMRAVAARYPDTPAGRALAAWAGQVATRSGKSVEELARAGAFLYVDFNGGSVREASSGRDPDVSSCDVVFYGVHRDGRWRIDVYRQNHRRGWSDNAYAEALKGWFLAGGVPAGEFE